MIKERFLKYTDHEEAENKLEREHNKHKCVVLSSTKEIPLDSCLKAGFKYFHCAPLKELWVLEKLGGEDLQGQFFI